MVDPPGAGVIQSIGVELGVGLVMNDLQARQVLAAWQQMNGATVAQVQVQAVADPNVAGADQLAAMMRRVGQSAGRAFATAYDSEIRGAIQQGQATQELSRSGFMRQSDIAEMRQQLQPVTQIGRAALQPFIQDYQRLEGAIRSVTAAQTILAQTPQRLNLVNIDQQISRLGALRSALQEAQGAGVRISQQTLDAAARAEQFARRFREIETRPRPEIGPVARPPAGTPSGGEVRQESLAALRDVRATVGEVAKSLSPAAAQTARDVAASVSREIAAIETRTAERALENFDRQVNALAGQTLARQQQAAAQSAGIAQERQQRALGFPLERAELRESGAAGRAQVQQARVTAAQDDLRAIQAFRTEREAELQAQRQTTTQAQERLQLLTNEQAAAAQVAAPLRARAATEAQSLQAMQARLSTETQARAALVSEKQAIDERLRNERDATTASKRTVEQKQSINTLLGDQRRLASEIATQDRAVREAARVIGPQQRVAATAQAQADAAQARITPSGPLETQARALGAERTALRGQEDLVRGSQQLEASAQAVLDRHRADLLVLEQQLAAERELLRIEQQRAAQAGGRFTAAVNAPANIANIRAQVEEQIRAGQFQGLQQLNVLRGGGSGQLPLTEAQPVTSGLERLGIRAAEARSRVVELRRELVNTATANVQTAQLGFLTARPGDVQQVERLAQAQHNLGEARRIAAGATTGEIQNNIALSSTWARLIEAQRQALATQNALNTARRLTTPTPPAPQTQQLPLFGPGPIPPGAFGPPIGGGQTQGQVNAANAAAQAAALPPTILQRIQAVPAAINAGTQAMRQFGAASAQVVSQSPIGGFYRGIATGVGDFNRLMNSSVSLFFRYALIGGVINQVSQAVNKVKETYTEATRAQFELTKAAGRDAPDLEKFARAAAGPSARSGVEVLTTVGNLAKLRQEYGLSAEQIKLLTQATIDLAAVNNESLDRSTNAVYNAIRGQGRALADLGVDVSARAVKQMADLTDEQRANYEAMGASEQAQVRVNELLRQAAAYHGAAAEFARSQAGAYQLLEASTTDLAESLGTLLAPAARTVATYLGEAAGNLNDITAAGGKVADANQIRAENEAIARTAFGMQPRSGMSNIPGAITGISQADLNRAMGENPTLKVEIVAAGISFLDFVGGLPGGVGRANEAIGNAPREVTGSVLTMLLGPPPQNSAVQTIFGPVDQNTILGRLLAGQTAEQRGVGGGTAREGEAFRQPTSLEERFPSGSLFGRGLTAQATPEQRQQAVVDQNRAVIDEALTLSSQGVVLTEKQMEAIRTTYDTVRFNQTTLQEDMAAQEQYAIRRANDIRENIPTGPDFDTSEKERIPPRTPVAAPERVSEGLDDAAMTEWQRLLAATQRTDPARQTRETAQASINAIRERTQAEQDAARDGIKAARDHLQFTLEAYQNQAKAAREAADVARDAANVQLRYEQELAQVRRTNEDRRIQDTRTAEDIAQREAQQASEREFKARQDAAEDAHKTILRGIDDEKDAAKEAADNALRSIDARKTAEGEAYKSATDAIQDQEQALQEAYKAQSRALDDQTKSIRDQADARDEQIQGELDLIDAQEQARSDARQDRDQARAVTDAQQGLAEALTERANLDDPKRIGAANEAVRKAREGISGAREDIGDTAHDREVRARRDALEDERKQIQDTTKARTDAIAEEKQALQDANEAKTKALKEEREALQETHDASERALTAERKGVEEARDARLRAADETKETEEEVNAARQRAFELERQRIADMEEAEGDSISRIRLLEDRRLQDRRAAEDADFALRQQKIAEEYEATTLAIQQGLDAATQAAQKETDAVVAMYDAAIDASKKAADKQILDIERARDAFLNALEVMKVEYALWKFQMEHPGTEATEGPGVPGAPPFTVPVGGPTTTTQGVAAEMRAAGGPIRPYRDYIVGEVGPELLRMGARGGYITPMRNQILGRESEQRDRERFAFVEKIEQLAIKGGISKSEFERERQRGEKQLNDAENDRLRARYGLQVQWEQSNPGAEHRQYGGRVDLVQARPTAQPMTGGGGGGGGGSSMYDGGAGSGYYPYNKADYPMGYDSQGNRYVVPINEQNQSYVDPAVAKFAAEHGAIIVAPPHAPHAPVGLPPPKMIEHYVSPDKSNETPWDHLGISEAAYNQRVAQGLRSGELTETPWHEWLIPTFWGDTGQWTGQYRKHVFADGGAIPQYEVDQWGPGPRRFSARYPGQPLPPPPPDPLTTWNIPKRQTGQPPMTGYSATPGASNYNANYAGASAPTAGGSNVAYDWYKSQGNTAPASAQHAPAGSPLPFGSTEQQASRTRMQELQAQYAAEHRQHGGPVSPGMDYLIGEAGPEVLRISGANGAVIPNAPPGVSASGIGKGGGTTVQGPLIGNLHVRNDDDRRIIVESIGHMLDTLEHGVGGLQQAGYPIRGGG